MTGRTPTYVLLQKKAINKKLGNNINIAYKDFES